MFLSWGCQIISQKYELHIPLQLKPCFLFENERTGSLTDKLPEITTTYQFRSGQDGTQILLTLGIKMRPWRSDHK